MLLQDIRYALRLFAKSPGFVTMAVVALGLGIGANSVIFSFFNVYLLRPLPSVKGADRVAIVNSVRRGNRSSTSYPDFLDWQQQNHVFQSLTAILYSNPILTGRGEPERVSGVQVSGGFFDVFTVRPALGRAFLPAENSPGSERVLKQAAWVVGIGIAIGVPGAAAVTKVLQSYLYGVGARDPITFVVIPALLAGVALAASYVPARRATRVDPLIALRYE